MRRVPGRSCERRRRWDEHIPSTPHVILCLPCFACTTHGLAARFYGEPHATSHSCTSQQTGCTTRTPRVRPFMLSLVLCGVDILYLAQAALTLARTMKNGPATYIKTAEYTKMGFRTRNEPPSHFQLAVNSAPCIEMGSSAHSHKKCSASLPQRMGKATCLGARLSVAFRAYCIALHTKQHMLWCTPSIKFHCTLQWTLSLPGKQ